VFKEWVPGDHVTLTKNPDYWNKAAGGPYLDSLTFKPIADTTATLNALQAGDVDISQTLAPVDVPTAQADTKLQYYDRGSACNVGVPGDEPEVQAVRQSQDPPGGGVRHQPQGDRGCVLRRHRCGPQELGAPRHDLRE
jgi:peptide/nickel transport system substrate-binding protein